MLTMHSTLLVGRYDWVPEILPEREFADRIAAFWTKVTPDAAAAIVYGDSRHHAELAYLSNFIPKLRPAVLVLRRTGPPTLLLADGAILLPSARRMTWVEDIRPLGGAAAFLPDLLHCLGGGVVLVGGDRMPSGEYREITAPFGRDGDLADATPILHAVMRRKSRAERDILDQAAGILRGAVEAMRAAHAADGDRRNALLAAEARANALGAQDVRSLLSTDEGRSLEPFDGTVGGIGATLHAYLAVRHHGYWADGLVTLMPRPASVVGSAADALAAAVAALAPGRRIADAVSAAARIEPHLPHPVTLPGFGSAIGLAAEEEPHLLPGAEGIVRDGDVYSLRIGALGQDGAALVSALVAVEPEGARTLWTSGGSTPRGDGPA